MTLSQLKLKGIIMKNKSLFQFSLSALFTMVLAACGSNGGNNDVPTTTATPTITPTPVVETNTTATTPAPEQKTEKPVENVDAQKLDVQPAESAFVGYKHVSKNNSRFLINEDTDGSKPHSADVPVGMNLRNLSPVMDTLVVAEPTMPDENGKMKVGYLEDLDLRAGDWRETGYNTEALAQAAAKSGYGVTGKVPAAIAVENQKNGTFPFLIMTGQNARDLLEGNGADNVDANNQPRPNYAYAKAGNSALDITRAEYNSIRTEGLAEIAAKQRALDNEIANTPRGLGVTAADWDAYRERVRLAEQALKAEEAAFSEAMKMRDKMCSAGRTCTDDLDNRRNIENDKRRYTVHVTNTKVTNRNNHVNTRIDDETNNELKSEFRSWSHYNPSSNNTKSYRKAVMDNAKENQYFAYTYQTNRTNYTDETMPVGMMAVPQYTNGKLTGFKYANTTADYANSTKDALTGANVNANAENLLRKSRTDLKIEDENETASSKLSGTTGGTDPSTDRISHENVARKDLNIAEVYGYRTFPAGANGYTIGEKPEDYKLNNLPLENKQLTKVQYGRVTSALSGHSSFDDFREGLPLDPTGKLETYVVSYGVFGQDGTEDHYFYRGIDSITPEQLKDLSAKTGGVLKYWGHAVSYGLDDKWDGNPESNVAPTAIGNTTVGRFVSGNHAHAVVDLKSGDVHGSIYNAWYNQDVADEARRAGNTDPKAGLYAVDLVKFNGRLATNGNISGTSVYQKDGSTGLFGANLYGSDASEIGGIVASDDKNKDKKWGAVFGGVRVGGGEIQNATNRGGL